MIRTDGRIEDDNADGRRGRPLQMETEMREELILDAAEALLVEFGPNQTTMDAIARRAGMSKRTIYELFASREQLLGACIARKSRAFLHPLGRDMEGRPLAERLEVLLTVNCAPSYQEASLELLRAIIAETKTYPWLAKAAYEGGHLALQRLVELELADGEKRGEIRLPSGRLKDAAGMLVDMVFEDPISRLLDPEAFCGDEIARERRRDLAISIFLKGVAGAARDAEEADASSGQS